MTFNELSLIEPVLKALINEGYSVPTPIQAQAIPVLLEGNDVLGCAQTGTGKTAAFSIPIIQKLSENETPKLFGKKHNKRKPIRALVLTPTRELAVQVAESFARYGKFTNLKHTVVYGGVSQRSQTDAIRNGVDILVATPGRLLDLVNQGYINLSLIEHFVLDEADLMLDMGFITDIQRVIDMLPEERQTLLFSATMPEEILDLAESLLRNPVKIEVTPASSTVEKIEQFLFFADKANKTDLLINILADEEEAESVLVFSRTKHGADKITKNLSRAGIVCDAIHGNKSQSARQKSLLNFKKRKTRVLVATDIAARGIDISQISHVVNYDLPETPETYVHRIGRTGRAGHSGTAFSFCDSGELGHLKSIQKLIGKEIDIVKDHDFECQVCVQKMERIQKSKPKNSASKADNGQEKSVPRTNSANSSSRSKRPGESRTQSSDNRGRNNQRRDSSEGRKSDQPRESSGRRDQSQTREYSRGRNQEQTREYSRGRNQEQPREYSRERNQEQPREYPRGQNQDQPREYSVNREQGERFSSKRSSYRDNTERRSNTPGRDDRPKAYATKWQKVKSNTDIVEKNLEFTSEKGRNRPSESSFKNGGKRKKGDFWNKGRRRSA